MLPTALDPERLEVIALVALGLVVVGIVLVLRFVQRMVVRVVIVGVLVAAGAGVWTERADLSACRPGGGCTFFGQDVQIPSISSR